MSWKKQQKKNTAGVKTDAAVKPFKVFRKIYKIFTWQCVTKYDFCSRIKADTGPV